MIRRPPRSTLITSSAASDVYKRQEANIGAPQVSYRETIRASSSGEGKFARQTGGKGQYGHVVIEVEPGEPGTGFEFVNKIVGGSVPKEYIKPAES